MVKLLATKKEYEDAVNSGKTIVIDFFAEWCGPCKMISPYFDELEAQYPDVEFCKIDVDQNTDASQSCGISAMPTFQVWKNGEKKKELVGASKDGLKALIEAAKGF